jgi:hypothetical protein
MYGGDDGARTRDLRRDREKEGRNLQKQASRMACFCAVKERSGTVIEPTTSAPWEICWLQSIPPPRTLICRHRLQSYNVALGGGITVQPAGNSAQRAVSPVVASRDSRRRQRVNTIRWVGSKLKSVGVRTERLIALSPNL